MSARFAEVLRANALDLTMEEQVIAKLQLDREPSPHCTQDIHIGIFFDGTNNNKFRDTPNRTHSNIARLYEVFPGTPARQTAPSFKPRVNADGGTTPRAVFPDQAFKPHSVAPHELPYYRKVYVPGVGTPFPDMRDGDSDADKTLGLSVASYSKGRLAWAMLQLCNQVHAAIMRRPIQDVVGVHDLKKPISAAVLASMSEWLFESMGSTLSHRLKRTGHFDDPAFEARLASYERSVKEAVAAHGHNKPGLGRIRLSVFGFSRGATKARAWVNMVEQRWGAKGLGGLPLQIDFLGLFDTVASVGLAHSAPGADGHFGWADGERLMVPHSVRRCVHLVSAMEVRGSFPLDSVSQSGWLPANCKEIVYPGVHSDVGGGYPPGDQGRSLPEGPEGDGMKLSQIPLAQMYREARMGGVPLAPPSAMDAPRSRNFVIHQELREDFNAYVAATRIGSVEPTLGKGEPAFARMYPSETQPREALLHVMRRHAGHALRWRKDMLTRQGGAAALLALSSMTADTRYQDAEDIRGAEAELKKEIDFLNSADPDKFKSYDDEFLELLDKGVLASSSALLLLGPLFHAAGRWGHAAVMQRVQSAMKDKQGQWDTWLRREWLRTPLLTGDKRRAVSQMMERYVHDSRAWFKPLVCSDTRKLAPDDETWFVLGGQQAERRRRLARLDRSIADLQAPQHVARRQCVIQERAALQAEGQPLILGGREPYRMWGYLRHRGVYQTGRLVSEHHDATQARIEREEERRASEARRLRAIEEEKASHAAERDRLREQSRRFNSDPARTGAQKDAYNEATKAKMARLAQGHAQRLAGLSQVPVSISN